MPLQAHGSPPEELGEGGMDGGAYAAPDVRPLGAPSDALLSSGLPSHSSQLLHGTDLGRRGASAAHATTSSNDALAT